MSQSVFPPQPTGLLYLFAVACGLDGSRYDPAFGAAWLEALALVQRTLAGDRDRGLSTALFDLAPSSTSGSGGGGAHHNSHSHSHGEHGTNSSTPPPYLPRRIPAVAALSICTELISASFCFGFAHLDSAFDLLLVGGAGAGAGAGAGGEALDPGRRKAGWSASGRADLLRAVLACASGVQLSAGELGIPGAGAGEGAGEGASAGAGASAGSSVLDGLLRDIESTSPGLFARSGGPSVDVESLLVGMMQAWLVEDARARERLRELHEEGTRASEEPTRTAMRAAAQEKFVPVLLAAVADAATTQDHASAPFAQAAREAAGAILIDAIDAAVDFGSDPGIAQEVALSVAPTLFGAVVEAACGQVYAAADERRAAERDRQRAYAERDAAREAAGVAAAVASRATAQRDAAEADLRAARADLEATRARLESLRMDVATRDLDRTLAEEARARAAAEEEAKKAAAELVSLRKPTSTAAASTPTAGPGGCGCVIA